MKSMPAWLALALVVACDAPSAEEPLATGIVGTPPPVLEPVRTRPTPVAPALAGAVDPIAEGEGELARWLADAGELRLVRVTVATPRRVARPGRADTIVTDVEAEVLETVRGPARAQLAFSLPGGVAGDLVVTTGRRIPAAGDQLVVVQAAGAREGAAASFLFVDDQRQVGFRGLDMPWERLVQLAVEVR